jgi:uncharacterized membrane protein
MGDLALHENIYIIASLMLVIVGNYLPTAKRSYFNGIPTPWAMKNDKVWYLTHRFAGWLFILIGIMVLFCTLVSITVRNKIAISCIIMGFIMVFAYSYVVSRTVNSNEFTLNNKENP